MGFVWVFPHIIKPPNIHVIHNHESTRKLCIYFVSWLLYSLLIPFRLGIVWVFPPVLKPPHVHLMQHPENARELCVQLISLSLYCLSTHCKSMFFVLGALFFETVFSPKGWLKQIPEVKKCKFGKSYRLYHGFNHFRMQSRCRKHPRCIWTRPRPVFKWFLIQTVRV